MLRSLQPVSFQLSKPSHGESKLAQTWQTEDEGVHDSLKRFTIRVCQSLHFKHTRGRR